MTDKELLELAAKAAGIDLDKSPCNGGGHGNTGFDVMGNAVLDWHNGKIWNPLTDDGDALRLAVRLRMMLTPSDDGHEVRVDLYTGHHWTEHCDDGAGTATRRSIVRAAAEIGKTNKD